MDGGKMDQLWKDGEEKPLLKLRFLQFCLSFYLRTLDLSVAPNLETLILESCDNLVKVDFQVTPNLKELRISHSDSLEKLHMLAESPNLETLSLQECTDLVELQFPAECPKLVTLNLYNLKLRTLHLEIAPNLETLIVSNCTHLVKLQIPAECPKLVNLDLRDCFRLAELPEEIVRLESLKELNISGTRISHLPESIFRMKGLRIVGSRRLLESCGFTSVIETSYDEAFCYI